jgi:hypothetical protein
MVGVKAGDRRKGMRCQWTLKKRERQVLILKDFTEEDLKAILAVEPSPADAAFALK